MINRHPEIKHWFCAGDVVDMFRPLHDTQPILRLFDRFNILSVTGNHDHRVKQRDLTRLDAVAKKYLEAMPFNIRVRFQNIKISIYHSTPTSRSYFISSRAKKKALQSHFDFDEADLFILGHTHHAYQKVFDKAVFINPGAVGIPEVEPSYCLVGKSGESEILYLHDAEV